MSIGRLLLTIIVVWICFNLSAGAQALDTAYLYFDTTSEATCRVDIGGEGKKEREKYTKIINGNRLDFYVCREWFYFYLDEDNQDTLDISYLQQIEFAEIEEMIKVVDRREKTMSFSYLSPDSAFEEIYVVEKINDRKVVRYNVFWQYYIE